MKKTKTNRIKVKLPTITTRDEAEALVGDIALITLNQIRTSAKMDAEINAVKKKYEGNLGQYATDLQAKSDTLCAWATANPDAFPKGRKSIDFVHGTIGFRTGTPKLALINRKWNWDLVLEAVQHVFPNFIRNKPEVDKEALLAQRDEQIIAENLCRVGLKVSQDESFYVEPTVTEVETRQVSEAA